MTKSNLHVHPKAEQSIAGMREFRTTPQTVEGDEIDLIALARACNRVEPTRVSIAALEQYLNLSNPICSG